jgi:hypothetical protein
MKTWIAGAVLAAGLALVGPVAPASAAATNSKAGIHASLASEATDLGARRRTRHVRHDAYRANDRPYYYYYDRPYDYRPYPYQTPVPFFLGFGFGPSW